ncbi:MAG: hypothetical protein QHJ73_03575 [Armatimonadota bacterium]|nr:hypothetical protein [Armatimonadota bacterium]
MRASLCPLAVALLLGGSISCARAANYVWWEAENPAAHTFPPSNTFRPNTAQERDKLSGGDWLQTDRGGGATARWEVEVPAAGQYSFWTRKFWRHGPFRWRWNVGPWQTCGRDCALADSVELRQHLVANWVFLGRVTLPAGRNTLEVEVLPDATAVAFDCWLLIDGPFMPDGRNKPGQKYNRADPGWFPFEPDVDPFRADAHFDLRSLNQKRAGDDGFVQARDGAFVFQRTGQPVKFWAVNASAEYDDRGAVDFLARRLAKMGVNMVRVHSPVFAGGDDPTLLNHKHLDNLHYFVAAMAKEGIYTKLSFYFPLWFTVKPSYGLPGFEKQQNKIPFALLFFHPRMQEIYRAWARGLLTTPNPYTGRSLADDPAVAIVEIINEDNYFFWTFTPYTNIPAECMEVLERAFGEWLARRYGSIQKAVESWGAGGAPPKGDDFANGRVGLYSAGTLTSQEWAVRSRNPRRAADTVQFLTEHQREFYAQMAAHFRRDLGVKCCISASNWTTADNRVLGALDKYTNMACDVLDRHAYFGGRVEGEGSNYSVRQGHLYEERTALYGPEGIVTEVAYTGHPHIVSEYSYPMPNRYRAELPWLTATYGSLTGTDGFFFFSVGTADWLRANTKWPVYAPVTMGQFPAMALAFRKGYVKEGPVVFHVGARLQDLYALKGTPIAQPQNLDDLRAADVPPGGAKEVPGMPAAMDPLAFFVGRVTMSVGADPGPSVVTDLTRFVDRQAKVVRSATGELAWDWGKGVVTCSAPCAQGACGFLGAAGTLTVGDLTIACHNEYGAVMAVSLDGQPLSRASKILLQVMTEDQNFGWKTEPAERPTPGGRPWQALRIVDLGAPPLEVRQLAGWVSLKRPDAAALKVTALDANGYARREVGRGSGTAVRVDLLPDCLYYVIGR